MDGKGFSGSKASSAAGLKGKPPTSILSTATQVTGSSDKPKYAPLPPADTRLKRPTSISSNFSTGFDIDASLPSRGNFVDSIITEQFKSITKVSERKMPTSQVKSARSSENQQIYGMPSYQSDTDTSSLRVLFNDLQFIFLTDVGVSPGDRPDGSIVGVLLLFHRADLKLLQPRVLLQNGFLGAMTTSVALGQIGLKKKNQNRNENTTASRADFTIASLLDGPNQGNTKSPLLAQLLLFDEKLFTQLKESNYPFSIRSGFETFTIPELSIRAQAKLSGAQKLNAAQPNDPKTAPSSIRSAPVQDNPQGRNYWANLAKF